MRCCMFPITARSRLLAHRNKLLSSKSKTAVVWRWYTCINTRAFAIRFHLHA